MATDEYDIIEQYLSGELKGAQLSQFEARMKTDSVFAGEVLLQKQMQSFLENKDKKAAFKDKLHTLGADFFEPPAKVIPIKNNRLRWLSLAAAIALLLIAAYFLMKPSGDLYQQYAVHQALQLTSKGSGDTDQLIKALENSFNNAQYPDALKNADALLNIQSDDLQLQMAKAICLIETNASEAAREILNPIADGQSVFQTEANWYLALSYVKEKNHAPAKNYLSKISSQSSFYEKAQDLLQGL